MRKLSGLFITKKVRRINLDGFILLNYFHFYRIVHIDLAAICILHKVIGNIHWSCDRLIGAYSWILLQSISRVVERPTFTVIFERIDSVP